MKTQAQRATDRARATLTWYMAHLDAGVDIKTAAADLIADLRHWVGAEGHEFSALLGRADVHFSQEIIEDQAGSSAPADDIPAERKEAL